MDDDAGRIDVECVQGPIRVCPGYVLKAALPARFFPRTTMVANSSTWDTVFRFTGGNSAEPLLLPTRDGNVIGIPKVDLSTMAAGTTTATKLIIAGDFQSGYLIADRLGMSVELIPHLFGATNRFPTVNGAYSPSGARAAA